MENVNNLILEHLKALRSGQERLENELKEMKVRLTSLESTVVDGRRDTVLQQEDIYRQQSSIDRLGDRIDRIERRLDLYSDDPNHPSYNQD